MHAIVELAGISMPEAKLLVDKLLRDEPICITAIGAKPFLDASLWLTSLGAKVAPEEADARY